MVYPVQVSRPIASNAFSTFCDGSKHTCSNDICENEPHLLAGLPDALKAVPACPIGHVLEHMAVFAQAQRSQFS